MKRDRRPLSALREQSPFAAPPRVLVVAEDDAAEALELAEALESAGAEAEVRFGDDMKRDHSHPDAVVVAARQGYRVARHHPILESVLHFSR